MLIIEDFNQHRDSKSAQKTIPEFGVTIYFRQKNNDSKFAISGYVSGFDRPEYICRVESIEECNTIFFEVCEKLSFLSKFQPKIDFKNFFEEIHNTYSNSNERRFKDTSDDGLITVRVKQEKGGWVALVSDYLKGTSEYKTAWIAPKVPTEVEAEEICKNCLNEYNIYSEYSRNVSHRRCTMEHEIIEEIESLGEEYYLYENGITIPISQERMEKIKIMIENGVI